MKVLIIRLSALGDVIQGIPCLVALKETFPEWRISWLVEKPGAPVLEGHPHLHKLFVLERDWRTRPSFSSSFLDGIRNLCQTWSDLRRERFDLAIDLQGLFKSGLWSYLSGALRRVGHGQTRELAHWFLNEEVGKRPTFDPTFPLVQRYLEPAIYLGADPSKGRYVLPPPSEETLKETDALLGAPQAHPETIALCPWSIWPSKNWPLHYWLELSKKLADDYRVLIIGGKGEIPFAGQFPSNENRSRTTETGILNLVGKTPLPVLAEIFRRCRLVIGPDSGPAHLANATGSPRILMLFGSTSWQRSGPVGEGHQALSSDLSCQPCFERVCPLSHFDCLNRMEVDKVFRSARKLLENEPEFLAKMARNPG